MKSLKLFKSKFSLAKPSRWAHTNPHTTHTYRACKIYVATRNYVLATHSHTDQDAQTGTLVCSRQRTLPWVRIGAEAEDRQQKLPAEGGGKSLAGTPIQVPLPSPPLPGGRVRYLNPCRKLSEKGLRGVRGWPDIENMILVFSNLNFKQVII